MYTGRHRVTKLLSTSSNGTPPRRSYAWKTNPAFEAEAQPTVISEDRSKTLRTRKYGNKSLPLPPIMDSLAIMGKQKHKQMKERVVVKHDELSEFQKKLRLNPYAQALATDIRQCRLTQAPLPSHFLIPFAADVPAAYDEDQSQRKPSLVPALRTKVQGKTYVSGTREAVDVLSGKKGKWQVLLNDHVKARAAIAMGKEVAPKEWTWDGEMKEIVLGQLRDNVVDALDRCSKRTSMVVDLLENDQVERDVLACILCSGSSASKAKILGSTKVPVYDMEVLLSSDQLERFMQSATRRKALVRHKSTVATVIALEKLSNYVQGHGKDKIS